MRFQNGDSTAAGQYDHQSLLQQHEEDKQKKIDRAARFGVEAPELIDQKRKERLERFKAMS